MPVTKQIKEQRRKFAEEAQAEYNKLTIQQKLDRLPPDGANKQRARLLALLEAQKKSALKQDKLDQERSTTDGMPENKPIKTSKTTRKNK